MLNVIKKSADFKDIYSRGRKIVFPSFVIYICAKEEPGLDFGLTVTKKQGNAVTRNRIKRRLRALIIKFHSSSPSKYAHKIVIVARKAALNMDFSKMHIYLESLDFRQRNA